MTMISKEEQWRKHINDRKMSGLNIREWCKTNSVSTSQYHYWNKKFNKLKNRNQEIEPRWAPLLMQNQEKSTLSSSPIVLQIGTFKVDIIKGFDKQTLTDLIQILGALC